MSLSAILIAVGTGLAVTVAAAVEPARPRLAASRRSRPSGRAWTRRRPGAHASAGWSSSSSSSALAGLLVWPRDAGAAGAIRALAVYGVLLIATLLVPFLVPGLARLGGYPFRLVFALEERLARATIVRDRSRSTLTLGALAVGRRASSWRSAGSASTRGPRPAPGSARSCPATCSSPRSDRPRSTSPRWSISASSPAWRGVSPIATFDLAVDGIAVDGAAMVGADLADDGRLTFVAGDRDAALRALDAGGAAIVPASPRGAPRTWRSTTS